MAYNFKNALVNLNEEIRKSGGGGGGDLPAIKLDVSQLKVSMAEVKASVANIDQEVDRIKEQLAALSPKSVETDTGLTLPDGSHIYQLCVTGLNITPLLEDWTDLCDVPSTINNLITCSLMHGGLLISGAGIEVKAESGKLSAQYLQTAARRSVNSLIVTYTKATQTRKGGKK